MLRLHTFGGCYLARDGVRLDALSGQRKGLALLAVLAAAGDRGVSRETLLGYLWPESDEERARTSLRQLVHALRAQLGAPELLLPSAELRLNAAAVASDVAAFREAVDRDDLSAAAALYAGPFLDGFHLRGADGFERWASAERGDLARRAARALERLAEQNAASGDVGVSIASWRRLVDLEPLSARATVGLMRALDMAGERAAALQHARVYESLVRQELDGPPDPSVTQLAARLRDAEPKAPLVPPAVRPAEVARVATPDQSPVAATPPPPTASAGEIPSPAGSLPRVRARVWLTAAGVVLVGALAGLGFRTSGGRAEAGAETAGGDLGPTAAAVTPSVAVLPFANTSGDPANEPLSDGLTDELIGALGRVPGLRVAGRTSVFALKHKPLGARAVGDTLGVATVVEASVRRAGDRVKVTAQLVSVGDNAVLWTESYESTVKDVITMQEEIARAIAAALRVRLVGARPGALVRHVPADPTAYERYLRGRHIFYTRPDRAGTREAARYFADAVARDPAYARAYAGLSDVHTRLAAFGFGRPLAEYARAKAAAARALSLDSTLAEAHVALAHAVCIADFEWRGAERAFRRAITLDPGYTFARLPFAVCLMGQGRFDEAIAQLDTARAADPLAPAPSNVLGLVYVNARQPEQAVRHLTDALELNPQMDLAYQQLGHAYLQQGKPAAAISAFRRAAALSGARDSAHLAYAYAVTGRRAEAERIVRSLVTAPGRYVPPVPVAMAYAGLGDADSAFRWLERGHAERTAFTVNVSPAFDQLHADPRWERLLRRMRLAPPG